MLDPIQWPSFDLPNILLPPIKRVVGILRRKVKVIQRRGRENSIVGCSKCKEVGHNMSCRGGSTSKQKKASTATATGEGDSGARTSVGPSGRKRKNASGASSSKGAEKGMKK